MTIGVTTSPTVGCNDALHEVLGRAAAPEDWCCAAFRFWWGPRCANMGAHLRKMCDVAGKKRLARPPIEN